MCASSAQPAAERALCWPSAAASRPLPAWRRPALRAPARAASMTSPRCRRGQPAALAPGRVLLFTPRSGPAAAPTGTLPSRLSGAKGRKRSRLGAGLLKSTTNKKNLSSFFLFGIFLSWVDFFFFFCGKFNFFIGLLRESEGKESHQQLHQPRGQPRPLRLPGSRSSGDAPCPSSPCAWAAAKGEMKKAPP